MGGSPWGVAVQTAQGTPPNVRNQQDKGSGDGVTIQGTTGVTYQGVALDTGATTETHTLATYNSLGVVHGLTLTYDSLRADPQPILNFGYAQVSTTEPFLAAGVSVTRGTYQYTVPGYNPPTANPALQNLNFWKIPDGATELSVGLQIDLQNQPTGVYQYTIKAGLMDPTNPSSTPLGTTTGTLIVVDTADSPFGQGWGIAGLEELVVNPDGTVLLTDGDGTAKYSKPVVSTQPNPGNTVSYTSLIGDHSKFEKFLNGDTFQRTMPDGTVYTFIRMDLPAGGVNGGQTCYVLSTVVDAVGNKTQYAYNQAGQIETITDPAGLVTTFGYSGNRVSTITDCRPRDPPGVRPQRQFGADHRSR